MLLGARREDVASEVLRMREEVSLLQDSCKCSVTIAYAYRSVYAVREEGDTGHFLKVFGQSV